MAAENDADISLLLSSKEMGIPAKGENLARWIDPKQRAVGKDVALERQKKELGFESGVRFRTKTFFNDEIITVYASIMNKLAEQNGRDILFVSTLAARGMIDKMKQRLLDLQPKQSNMSLQEAFEDQDFAKEVGLAGEMMLALRRHKDVAGSFDFSKARSEPTTHAASSKRSTFVGQHDSNHFFGCVFSKGNESGKGVTTIYDTMCETAEAEDYFRGDTDLAAILRVFSELHDIPIDGWTHTLKDNMPQQVGGEFFSGVRLVPNLIISIDISHPFLHHFVPDITVAKSGPSLCLTMQLLAQDKKFLHSSYEEIELHRLAIARRILNWYGR
jgi:hypothetical protein